MKGSRRARRLLIGSKIVCHPWEYYSRRKAAKALATRPPGVGIRNVDGFVRFGESDFKEVSSIVRLCQQIFARSGSRECVDLAGPPGSGVFLDTSRCLHFGSRMEPGRIRLVFHAQFLRYHFAYSCSANRFDRTRAGGDAIRSRLLAQRPGMPVISASSRVD
jgi:hypothetical protein